MKAYYLFFLLASLSASAQTQTFEEDFLQRGYYDRAWQRYEAEPEKCITNCEYLLPPDAYSQTFLQSEASNQSAVVLKSENDFVEWIVDKPGRGLTIRFSLPDSSDGKGNMGNLELRVDGKKIKSIVLDSKWAWQYTGIAYSPEKYPDNTPGADKFARMRFDEVYSLLDEDIPEGATLTLAKTDKDDIEYCIDFIELEPVGAPLTFEQIESPDKVYYDGSTSLSSFISANSGKTIFLPEGIYDMRRQLVITGAGTKIIGAGMWYTHLYFSTPSDSRSTYNSRGIYCNVSDVVLQGMSINTANDKRYFENNPSYQVGKGLNGSWGSNSVIRDVRIDHFECGGWITGAVNLSIEHCRFRNNYADGINLANNSTGCRVSHCSFRNNGDDDMASWSTGGYATDNEFSYCTAENNWRASSIGFFGGRRNRGHHLAIYDALEAGARVVCDFNGTGFSSEGFTELSEITIRRCGARQGMAGTQGGFWGDSAASLQIGAGWAYDLNNLNIHNIDIYNSRHDAISIKCSSGKSINNLNLNDINIYGVDDYAFGINIDPGVRGYGSYGEIHAEDVTEPFMSKIPDTFNFAAVSGISEITESNHEEESFGEYCVDLSGYRVSRKNKRGVYIVIKNGVCNKIFRR